MSESRRSHVSDGLQPEPAAPGAPSSPQREVVWRRLLSRHVQFAMDLSMLTAAFVLAYLLRFDFQVPLAQVENGLAQLPYVVAIQFVALLACGVYNFLWRYIGTSELMAFARAAWWSFLPILLVRLLLPQPFGDWRVPLSVILIDTVLAFGGILGLRVLRRMVWERYERTRANGSVGTPPRRKPVILIGAGSAGVMAVREITRRGSSDVWVEGFVDDDPGKQGAVIDGKRVLGTTRDLPQLCADRAVDHVILTIAEASRRDLRRIVEICERVPVRMRAIPGLQEILDGRVEVTRFRDVDIEDLLGREPVHLDEVEVATFISGRAVMVTGAGGSIGSELARQVARFRPSSLLLLERAEFALFDIDRELRGRFPDLSIVPVVADVTDEGRMVAVHRVHRPQVVVHAAAHKHVPMMELNPTEAIKNNVLGTECAARVAGDHGVEAFVLISTDKAVRPTSVMGASKRVAELVIQDLDERYPYTRFVAVRFGNVMGSAGSVIPIFREQIQHGGPVTVTDENVVRYFMTIPEASQLVLQAGAMGRGGEIFVLDMGEPVRILDLAKDMISLHGLKPFTDIDIVFTGLRPGEKLFEELEVDGEDMSNTRHPKIFVGHVQPYPHAEVTSAVERLALLARRGDEDEISRCLGDLLPEAHLMVVRAEAEVVELGRRVRPAHLGLSMPPA